MTKNSSTLCLDASIVVRLVTMPENIFVQELWAFWQKENHQRVAPNLLYYEVANAIYQQEKHSLIKPSSAKEALEIALNLPIQLVGDVALHQRARKLAVQYNLPATYDAHYLALAERLNIELWTADARLYNAVQAQGVEWVKLVEK